jgi:hypothetical protein
LKSLPRAACASTLFLNSVGVWSRTSSAKPTWWSTTRRILQHES